MAGDLVIEKIRRNPGKKTFDEIALFTLPMADEAAIVPMILDDALASLYRAMTEGMTWVARADGALVGILTMIGSPYWYNHGQTLWVNQLLYVTPDARGTQATAQLCRAARDALLALGDHGVVHVLNPSLRRGFRIIPLC